MEPPLADAPTHPPTDQPSHFPSTGPPTASVPMSPSMSRVLTESDLPVLMRILSESAHCTFQLGIQLHLGPDLVLSLEHQAMGDPVKFLSLVLTTRLQRTTPPTTVQVLVDAISEPPVSDEVLAWKLQQYLMEDDQQDYYATVVPTPHLMAAKHLFQLLAVIIFTIYVSWSVPMSPEMAEFIVFLDDVHENIAIPADAKGSPTPATKYTNLALIKKEQMNPDNADEFMKATFHGRIDQIVNRKEAIKLKDIFKPEKGQPKVKLILVEGPPGVGKTTLAWELCRRRHEIEALTAFAVVVFLKLHEKRVQRASSVADLFYHDDPDIQQAVAKEISSNAGDNLLLILDGFDEVPAPDRKSLFLAQVISGECLPKATVLVTSRPSARADLLSLRQPHKHIEVLGLTHTLINEYASDVFGSNPPLLDDFLKYIATNPGVKSMMYIPLNSAIVVDIYQVNRREGRPIPQTMTQLYSELTLTLMSRHLNDRSDKTIQSLPEKLEDVYQENKELHDQLLSLAKLAFEGTLDQKMISEILPAGHSTLGLMTTSPQLYTRRKVSAKHSFFHQTFQEFMSAFYVSQLSSSEQKQAFIQFSDKPHMDLVSKFVAGLTGFRAIGWDLILSGRGIEFDEVTSFLVQCLYEAQEKADCESVLGRSKVRYHSKSDSVVNYFAVGYCIAVCSCTWELLFIYSHFGPETLEMLRYGLRSQENVRGSINVLELSGTAIGWEGIEHLREMPHEVFQQLSYLGVFQCNLDGRALDLLSDMIIPMMPSLKHLDISFNPAAGNGTRKLLQTLANTGHLHTLEMDRVPIGCDDIALLADLIRSSGSLKMLSIGDNLMEHGCAELLLKRVSSPSSLEHLTLDSVVMNTYSVENMKENNITHLEFLHLTMENKTIAEVLHSNTRPENLRFDHALRSITSLGYVLADLSHALRVISSFEVLVAWCTGSILRAEARALFGALQQNQQIQEMLYLPEHCQVHFSHEELMAMSNRVWFCKLGGQFQVIPQMTKMGDLQMYKYIHNYYLIFNPSPTSLKRLKSMYKVLYNA